MVFRVGFSQPGFAETLANRIVFLPAGLAVLALAWRAAALPGLDEATRRAWRLLTLAFGLISLGNLLWCLETYSPMPDYTLAHTGWLLYYPVLLGGILSFPREPRRRPQRQQFWIAAAAVLCGGGMLLWYAVLGPAVRGPAPSPVTLAYPLGDLPLLLGIAFLALRRRDEPERPAFQCLALGLLIEFSGDVAYGVFGMTSSHAVSVVADMAYMVGWCLRGTAAYIFAARTGQPRPAAGDAAAGISVLPYGFAAVGFVTLVVAAGDADVVTLRILIAGAAVLVALALTSQAITARDNESLQAQHSARRTEARFRTLVQNSSDVIAVVNENGLVVFLAPSAEGILERALTEIEGRPFIEMVHPDDRTRARLFHSNAALQPGVSGPTELRIAAGGERYLTMEAVATNLVADPEIAGVVVTLHDVGDRKALEQQLMHRALHDPLTGLANRALFADRLHHARSFGMRDATRFAVVIADLDDFKIVNDRLGHATGDQVLIEAARRLRAAVRGTDTAARLGGDEFAVLLEAIPDEATASSMADDLRRAIEQPFTVRGREIHLHASIGVALSDAGLTEDEVLRQADLALYHAKESGKSRSVLFVPGMQSELLRRHETEGELRRAIDNGELHLLFQPVMSLRRSRLVGAEALVRWRHPRRGMVLPADFIDLAETSGLIEPLGEWVLEEACHQAADWNQNGRKFYMSVNLSVQQLNEPAIVGQVRHALDASGLPPDRLICEITETMLARDPLAAAARLYALKDLGVRLALDDFGTGYSSLGRLRELPIDIIKIDGSFARDLTSGPGSALVRAIVYLGKAIDLLVIGEGIESAEQAAALRVLGCDLAQGFHFGAPAEAADVARLWEPTSYLPT